MATTADGTDGRRKFDNTDLAEVFTGSYRRERGKIEVSAAEITEILNEEILEEKTVTRQAVDKRLNEVIGTNFQGLDGKLVREKHGRTYLYYRDVDLEKVFADGGVGALTFPAGSAQRLSKNWIKVLYAIAGGLFIAGGILEFLPGTQSIDLVVVGTITLIAAFAVHRLYRIEVERGNNFLWRLGERVAEPIEERLRRQS